MDNEIVIAIAFVQFPHKLNNKRLQSKKILWIQLTQTQQTFTSQSMAWNPVNERKEHKGDFPVDAQYTYPVNPQNPNQIKQNVQNAQPMDMQYQQHSFPMHSSYPSHQMSQLPQSNVSNLPNQSQMPMSNVSNLSNQQQSFPNSSMNPMMYHPPNYPVPMQSYPNYPTPFDTQSNYPYSNQMGLQSMSPFQYPMSGMNQMNGIKDFHSTQPLPSQFPFQQNQENMKGMQPVHGHGLNELHELPHLSQSQPLHLPSSYQSNQPLQPEEEQKNDRITDRMSPDDPAAPLVPQQEAPAAPQINGGVHVGSEEQDDGPAKPRLEYDKLTRFGHVIPWLLNGRERIDVNVQILEEQKVFGDTEQIYCGMKRDAKPTQFVKSMSSKDINVQKQNARLFLDKKAQLRRLHDEEKNDEVLCYGMDPCAF